MIQTAFKKEILWEVSKSLNVCVFKYLSACLSYKCVYMHACRCVYGCRYVSTYVHTYVGTYIGMYACMQLGVNTTLWCVHARARQ